jgi:hypothetical protein
MSIQEGKSESNGKRIVITLWTSSMVYLSWWQHKKMKKSRKAKISALWELNTHSHIRYLSAPSQAGVYSQHTTGVSRTLIRCSQRLAPTGAIVCQQLSVRKDDIDADSLTGHFYSAEAVVVCRRQCRYDKCTCSQCTWFIFAVHWLRYPCLKIAIWGLQ